MPTLRSLWRPSRGLQQEVQSPAYPSLCLLHSSVRDPSHPHRKTSSPSQHGVTGTTFIFTWNGEGGLEGGEKIYKTTVLRTLTWDKKASLKYGQHIKWTAVSLSSLLRVLRMWHPEAGPVVLLSGSDGGGWPGRWLLECAGLSSRKESTAQKDRFEKDLPPVLSSVLHPASTRGNYPRLGKDNPKGSAGTVLAACRASFLFPPARVSKLIHRCRIEYWEQFYLSNGGLALD